MGEKVARSCVRHANELVLWEEICGPEENRAHHLAGQRALQTQMVINMIEASFFTMIKKKTFERGGARVMRASTH